MRTGCGVKQQSPGYRFITDQYGQSSGHSGPRRGTASARTRIGHARTSRIRMPAPGGVRVLAKLRGYRLSRGVCRHPRCGASRLSGRSRGLAGYPGNARTGGTHRNRGPPARLPFRSHAPPRIPRARRACPARPPQQQRPPSGEPRLVGRARPGHHRAAHLHRRPRRNDFCPVLDWATGNSPGTSQGRFLA